MNRKPPIGIKPRKMHIEERLEEIDLAAERYNQANLSIPGNWITEIHELSEELRSIMILEKDEALMAKIRKMKALEINSGGAASNKRGESRYGHYSVFEKHRVCIQCPSCGAVHNYGKTEGGGEG